METKKIFNLINHWLMMGLVFVYSQALSTEFDIARSDNDCHKLASTINPENLPDELNINIHKEMCKQADNAGKQTLKGRNVLIVHTQSPIKYVFIVSGLSPKQSAFYESPSRDKFPVVDAYDILKLNWKLTQEESDAIDEIQGRIENCKIEIERLSIVEEKKDTTRSFLSGKAGNVIDTIRDFYVPIIMNYYNEQDKICITGIRNQLNAERANLTSKFITPVDFAQKIQILKGNQGQSNYGDRFVILNDLFHTEILLRYAMEKSIKVTINGIEIDFGAIANRPIINICSRNDMCYNCEYVLADFAQKHPDKKIYVSSVNAYPHPTRYAPYQFGSSTTVNNIFKIAFTNQDSAKSNPSSPATSPRPSSSSSAEPLPDTPQTPPPSPRPSAKAKRPKAPHSSSSPAHDDSSSASSSDSDE